MNRKFNLELRFRQSVPGLYSRMVSRKKALQEKEALRDAAVKERERKRLAHERHDHPSAGPDMGRRKKNRSKSQEAEALAEEDMSEDESEPDLGPLRTKKQLKEIAIDGNIMNGQMQNE